MGSQKEEWVSLREFARLCGRSHRAAQKAIEDRRIPASAIRHDAQGHIVAVEYHQASACWRANSDPRRSLKGFPPRSPRLPVQTSGRDPVLDERVPQLLGVAFANALIPACAMSVWRHGLSPGQALDAHEDQLLAVMYAIADALQLSPDDDRPRVLFRDDLELTLHPERRGALLERIQLVADQFGRDQAAAKAAGELGA